jgi:hypothetical protein
MVTKTIRCLLVIAGMMFVVVPCFADGVAFRGWDFRSMRPIAQNEQRAVISHHLNTEKMLIAISLDLEDEDNAIWIFPVPGKPETVKVDVLDSFPTFFGKDPRIEAYEVLATIRNLSLLTQIYPAFTCLCLMPSLSFSREAGISFEHGFIVHGSIEKWGIRAETITAQSPEALSDYLKEKKVGLGADELKPFERYLAGDYVLVVVWIDSKAQLLKQFSEYASGETSRSGRWPCLYVEFPTKRAFYPLLPTSVYGDTEIQIDIVAIEYFALDSDSKLAGKFRPKYYKQSKISEKMPAQLADEMPDENISYTRFRFRGPAKDLTDDLWLKPTSPPGFRFAEAILDVSDNLLVSDNPLVLFGPILCYIALVSYLSAGIAGLVLYRRWRGFDLLGFCNVFTIVAVYFTARWAKNLLAAKLQNSGKVFSIGRFLAVFSVVFILLNYLMPLLIWIFP